MTQSYGIIYINKVDKSEITDRFFKRILCLTTQNPLQPPAQRATKGMAINMKNRQIYISSLLLISVVLLLLQMFPLSIAAEGEADESVFVFDGKEYQRSKDVPAIYINGAENVNVYGYVPCSVVAIDKIGGDLKEAADKNATIRIRGNSTSSGAKRPYNIKFSSNVNLFGMGKGKRYCLIANMYDPTLLRNHAVFEFAKAIGMEFTLDSMLVDVYVNGSYMGCYQLCEAPTADDDRVDIDCDAGDFLIERDARTDYGTTYFTTMLGHRFGINEPENTTAKQSQDIQDFIRKAEQAIQNRDYEQVKQYFDIDSMIDMYICMEFFKNVDITVGSTRFYCKDGKIHGGPVWDFDLSSGNCSSSYYVAYNNNYGDSAEGLWAMHIWFDDLIVYFDEYREAVYARYLELQDQIINLYQDNVLGKNVIDSLIASASTSISRNFNEAPWKPWQNYSELMRQPDSTYEKNVEYFRAWLVRRNTWLLNYWGIADRVKPKTIDETVSFEGQYLRGVLPETSVTVFKSLFAEDVSCNTAGNFVSTGDVVRGTSASYYVVIDGDLNQDGNLTVADYLLQKQVLYNNKKVDGAVYQAACGDQQAPNEGICDKIKRYYFFRK